MRVRLALTALLLSLSLPAAGGCGVRRASGPGPASAAQADQASDRADDQASHRAPVQGKRATAEEYYRQVMARAARRNARVTWVNSPRGDGYILDRALPNSLQFQGIP